MSQPDLEHVLRRISDHPWKSGPASEPLYLSRLRHFAKLVAENTIPLLITEQSDAVGLPGEVDVAGRIMAEEIAAALPNVIPNPMEGDSEDERTDRWISKGFVREILEVAGIRRQVYEVFRVFRNPTPGKDTAKVQPSETLVKAGATDERWLKWLWESGVFSELEW